MNPTMLVPKFLINSHPGGNKVNPSEENKSKIKYATSTKNPIQASKSAISDGRFEVTRDIFFTLRFVPLSLKTSAFQKKDMEHLFIKKLFMIIKKLKFLMLS